MYGYPQDEAAEVAVQTIKAWLNEKYEQYNATSDHEDSNDDADSNEKEGDSEQEDKQADGEQSIIARLQIVFCVFLDSDLEIYKEILN